MREIYNHKLLTKRLNFTLSLLVIISWFVEHWIQRKMCSYQVNIILNTQRYSQYMPVVRFPGDQVTFLLLRGWEQTGYCWRLCAGV